MLTRFILIVVFLGVFTSALFANHPNLLIITVDDMNADSIGAFGAELESTSPNVDRLAAEGLSFDLAHVQVGNCYPSRNVMWSGRYSHNNGAEGFYEVKPINYPTLCDLMQKHGYWVGIRGKVSHSSPYQPFHWDADLTFKRDGTSEHMKDARSYFRSVKRGIKLAENEGKPFCINVNISDPHKPFWKPGDPHPVSKVFTADEVPVPGFLPDDPAIREELALYYTSVRRADDCVGEILEALSESGKAEETFVMFLSDHGMPLPFAKTQLYHHSTRTPLIVRWPGVAEPGTRDDEHMVSAVDFLPTLLDVVGAKKPGGFDGSSFAPLFHGEKLPGRDSVFKVYNENSGAQRHPIRGVETPEYLYLFNPWSDRVNKFKTATQGTVTYKRLIALAEEDAAIAARLDLFDYRVLEELYDVRNDPDCLVNLIDDPSHEAALSDLRARAEKFMRESGDHALEPFLNREDPEAVAAYITRVTEEAQARRAERRKNKRETGGKDKKKSA
ncbi:MAG: sulfatase [Verrucomicrobiales bacterium]|nr:sulfatase [Verrucomicrobiales bacterium]